MVLDSRRLEAINELAMVAGNCVIEAEVRMNDEKLKALWGPDLFQYAYDKSIELTGSPLYDVMVMVAISKIRSNLVSALGGLGL